MVFFANLTITYLRKPCPPIKVYIIINQVNCMYGGSLFSSEEREKVASHYIIIIMVLRMYGIDRRQ